MHSTKNADSNFLRQFNFVPDGGFQNGVWLSVKTKHNGRGGTKRGRPQGRVARISRRMCPHKLCGSRRQCVPVSFPLGLETF